MLASFWVRRPTKSVEIMSNNTPYNNMSIILISPDEIYLPVLRSTQTLEILNLILRIMCEAWLDHIYTQKIPFR